MFVISLNCTDGCIEPYSLHNCGAYIFNVYNKVIIHLLCFDCTSEIFFKQNRLLVTFKIITNDLKSLL